MIDWKDLIWISTQSTELAFQEIMVIKFKDPVPKIFYKVMDLFPTWVLTLLNSQDIEEITNMLNLLINTQEVIFLWEVKAPMLILISKKSQRAMTMSTTMINSRLATIGSEEPLIAISSAIPILSTWLKKWKLLRKKKTTLTSIVNMVLLLLFRNHL